MLLRRGRESLAGNPGSGRKLLSGASIKPDSNEECRSGRGQPVVRRLLNRLYVVESQLFA